MGTWNGVALIDELSALLSDTTTSGKARTAKYINDIMVDISSRHRWNFTLYRGQKVLTADSEEQNLSIDAPSAATIAASSGGSLSVATYSVKIAFGESVANIESLPSPASEEITTDAVNKTLSLTAIPVSSDPLVNRRFIYLKMDSGDYLYHGQILDNTTTTYSITSNASENGVLERNPMEHDYISQIMGNLYDTSSSQLKLKSIEQLRFCISGEFSSGVPLYWSPLGANRCLMYPSPSSARTISFYYHKIPNKIYYDESSIPELPIFLKEALTKGVEWKGYDYRDRSGKIEMKNLYESEIFDIISRMGQVTNAATRVRDVTGDSDSLEI